MSLRLRERLEAARLFYTGLAVGFILGAATMASPALAMVAAGILLLDLIRRAI
ncbi:hypothetical protein [Tabrizicola sp. BL-A-41-H6]|uniref:hypothetical protein n=1 Tax=Tabrizicola sp. BL-A-41-H6 TaxID=3421107 RepID=UPI003D66E0E9